MQCLNPTLIKAPASVVERRFSKYPRGSIQGKLYASPPGNEGDQGSSLGYYKKMPVPCRDCPACRSSIRREWVARMVHESLYHSDSMFVTLTYSDHFLPYSEDGLGSLRKADYVKFLKRLRHHLCDKKIRYYGCGEYGENTRRPHYHFIIFGLSCLRDSDRQKIIDSWLLGNVHITDCNIKSMSYVAGYVTKKLAKGDTYEYSKEREIRTGSQGLGRQWLDDNVQKVINDGNIRISGYPQCIPRYYANRLLTKYGFATENFTPQAEQHQESLLRQLDIRDVPSIEYLYIQGHHERDLSNIVKYEEAVRAHAKQRNLNIVVLQNLNPRGVL